MAIQFGKYDRQPMGVSNVGGWGKFPAAARV